MMYAKLMNAKLSMQGKCKEWKEKCMEAKHPGIDGILVTVGLCIIALVLCVLMQSELKAFIQDIVGKMTDKAGQMLLVDPTVTT